MKHVREQAKKGRTVYAVKPALLTAKPSQMTTLVGFPTNKTILAVLAAANSDINQAMGFNYQGVNIINSQIYSTFAHLSYSRVIHQEHGASQDNRIITKKYTDDC